MKSDRHKNYTVNNNVNATHNLLNALVETQSIRHLVHLGTMGVYGYSTVGAAIPEGYLPVGIETADRPHRSARTSSTPPIPARSIT
jgi:UDP-sulfoquinovose synthase